MKTLYRTRRNLSVLSLLMGLSALALLSTPATATTKASQSEAAAQSKGDDIEITGMDTDLDCADLDINYSHRNGEIYVSFDDAFSHDSGDGYKTHCLVDLYVYVPEGLRFATRNLALAGTVVTDSSTTAAVATSFRTVGKAGAVATERFAPDTKQDFYLESSSVKVLRPNTAARQCNGYSMTLRLRVDLMLEEQAKRPFPAGQLGQKNDSAIQVDSAALRYRATAC